MMMMRMAGEPEKAVSTTGMAGDFGLSRNHLIKIMQRLAHGGIVETRRGAVLGRPPAKISLGDVVRVLDSDQPPGEVRQLSNAWAGPVALPGRRALPAEGTAAAGGGGVQVRT